MGAQKAETGKGTDCCPCGHRAEQHVERIVHGNDPPEEFVERKCTKCECVDTRVKKGLDTDSQTKSKYVIP